MNATTERVTLIVCGECGEGFYRWAARGDLVACTAGCGHELDVARDLFLDSDEVATFSSDLLGYVTVDVEDAS